MYLTVPCLLVMHVNVIMSVLHACVLAPFVGPRYGLLSRGRRTPQRVLCTTWDIEATVYVWKGSAYVWLAFSNACKGRSWDKPPCSPGYMFVSSNSNQPRAGSVPFIPTCSGSAWHACVTRGLMFDLHTGAWASCDSISMVHCNSLPKGPLVRTAWQSFGRNLARLVV